MRHLRRWFFVGAAASALLAPAAEAAARPDLAVKTPMGVPASAATIEGFEASATVRNAGSARSAATKVTFFLSKDSRRGAGDLRFETEAPVPALKPGRRATRSARIVVPAEAKSGRWFVLACADAAKRIREVREGDNCAPSRALTVAGPRPLTVSFTRHSDLASESDSSEVSATGPDGTLYALSLGESDSVADVRLTPISAIAPAPTNVTPAAGVLIEPAGRLLGSYATLTITPPAGGPARPIGFGAAADGGDFHLEPARRETLTGNDGVEFQIDEFGLYGFGTLPAGVSPRVAPRAAVSGAVPSAADMHIPASTRNQVSQRLALNLENPAEVERISCDYYREVVRPRLVLATRSGSLQLVGTLVREVFALGRTGDLLGAGGSFPYGLACLGDADALFKKILRRLFDEAYAQCTTAGGDPFKGLKNMLSVLRQGELLGYSGDVFGDDAYDKVQRCLDVKYDVTYTGDYKSGGADFYATGSMSGQARVSLAENVWRDGTLVQPIPSATYVHEDCSGTHVGGEPPGVFRARATVFYEEHHVGRFVNGRYDPKADVVSEPKVRVSFAANSHGNFRIDCGGGASVWDLGASDSRSNLIYAPAGGTVSFADPPFDPACAVDCQSVAGSLTIRTVGSP